MGASNTVPARHGPVQSMTCRNWGAWTQGGTTCAPLHATHGPVATGAPVGPLSLPLCHSLHGGLTAMKTVGGEETRNMLDGTAKHIAASRPPQRLRQSHGTSTTQLVIRWSDHQCGGVRTTPVATAVRCHSHN